jgi:DNA-binding response OmpR family regulator
MTRVLLIEDDPSIAEAVQVLLARSGYTVDVAGSGPAGWQALHQRRPDAVLLDLSLPGLHGVELLQRLREVDDKLPILVLTADSSTQRLVQVLELGADDYVIKPYRGPELVARLRAALRRASPGGREMPGPSAPLAFGSIRLDRARAMATVGGVALDTSPTELRLLEVFLERPAELLPATEITRRVWGPRACLDRSTLRVNLYRLRRKLDATGVAWGRFRHRPGFGWGLFATEG